MISQFQKIVDLFSAWAKLKPKIHFRQGNVNVYFKHRQIWWASVGQNIGVESNGKNRNFERPVIILKKFNALSFLAVVLSTKPRSGEYYYHLSGGRDSFANLSQVKIMSSKRLVRRVGEVTQGDFDAIKEKIKTYL